MPPKPPNSRRDGRTLLVAILVLILLAPMGYYVAMGGVGARASEGEPFLEPPDPPDPECDRCVGNMTAAEMRTEHWQYLHRIREDVVRFGKRTEHGLDSCRTCHKSRERFCDRCHNTVSLTPDCFGCHNYQEPELDPSHG